MRSDEKIDVLVIGGAAMGASVAFWLTRMQPGLSVMVVEKDASFAHSATALSVASIRQQFTTAVNVEISRFGIDFIRNIAAHLGQTGGISTLGLKENGYLFVTGNPEAAVLMHEVGLELADEAVLFGATLTNTTVDVLEQLPETTVLLNQVS